MKRNQKIANLIKTLFLLLMSIQVVLGCLWICKNGSVIPRFGESTELIQASKDWILDEYIGVLYPLFIRMSCLVENLTGIAFCTILYLVQLVLAFAAYAYFLKKVVFHGSQGRKTWEPYLLATYIVTFPPILQCHMSVLPYSPASSMVLLLTAELKSLLTSKENGYKDSLVKICVYWFISALLLPDYGFIAGMIVAAGFIILGRKQRQKIVILLMAAVMTVVSLGITTNLSQTPGSLGRIQKSAGAAMLSRFTWPYFERNAFFWQEEVKELFDEGELNWISLYPENVIYEFGPKLEEAVGLKRANEIYWEMAVKSLGLGKKEALSALSRDLAANVTGPVSMQLQLNGTGISYAGWNYGCMKEYSPILTRYFVRFSMYSFDFLLMVSAILWLASLGKKETRRISGFTAILMITIAIVTIWYTIIGNGMQDYIKIVLINVLWCMGLARTYKELDGPKEDV